MKRDVYIKLYITRTNGDHKFVKRKTNLYKRTLEISNNRCYQIN